jgi:hypothetical protein
LLLLPLCESIQMIVRIGNVLYWSACAVALGWLLAASAATLPDWPFGWMFGLTGAAVIWMVGVIGAALIWAVGRGVKYVRGGSDIG